MESPNIPFNPNSLVFLRIALYGDGLGWGGFDHPSLHILEELNEYQYNFNFSV